MSIRKEQESEEFERDLYDKVDAFFENLHGVSELEYREGQHSLALSVVDDTIKNHNILLIESGVGSGKSWGYLIPLIYASQNKEKFKGFIISTSSIALQEQLEKDIAFLSEMLGIHIDVTVAKGRNNYICKRKLEELISERGNSPKLQSILKKVSEGKIDKKYFDDVQPDIWRKISVGKVSCNACLFKTDCNYRLKRKEWKKHRGVICNHDLLVEDLKRDSERHILPPKDVLVIDEAHTLEEKIRNSYEKELTKPYLESLVYGLYNKLGKNLEDDIPVIECINGLFRAISTRAKYEYRKNAQKDVAILDEEESGFTCNKNINEQLSKTLTELQRLIYQAKRSSETAKDFLENISKLEEVERVLKDLAKSPSEQKNIFIAAFIPNTRDHIKLQYIPKNIPELSAKLFKDPSYGKVFTSATMTTSENNYSYFMRNLGLDNIVGIPITKEFSQASPYDYDKNAILYFSSDTVTPKTPARDLYIESLSSRIEELMDITNGRTLVLFTSKKDMQEVYDYISQEDKSYNILIQEEGKNTEALKTTFKEDETSCLFATGAFWEGIDIKGPSLEQVIIAKLPFPTVNPIIQEKASHYTDSFSETYLKEMLIKLKQGTGRAIRSDEDKAVISIIDPRAREYIKPILGTLPYTNVTNNIEDVKSFAKSNLTKEKVLEKTSQQES